MILYHKTAREKKPNSIPVPDSQQKLNLDEKKLKKINF